MRVRAREVRRLVLVALALCATELVLDVAWPYPLERLRDVAASRVFIAADGSLLRAEPTRQGERCLPVALSEVSPHVVDALICAEDQRFREHSGVDPAAVLRALIGNVAAGRVTSGASTITMQLARLVEPRPRSLTGKFAEAIRARQIERRLTKDEIVEAYLNRVPFGGTTRGIEAAARRWYGKSARDLSVGEASALVAMLPSPTAMAPDLGGVARLAASRDEVLARMEDAGRIDARTRRTARSEALPAFRYRWPYRAPHACDLLGGREGSRVVETTIDLDLQTRIEDVARAYPAGGTDGVAVVVLDRADAELRAMLGSRDYRTHPLNAATCRRSAGSTLKPFLYAIALDSGIAGPDQLVRDTPLAFHGYVPRNFEGEYRGAVTAAEALATSRNLPAIRLLREVGPERFADLLLTVGVPVPHDTLHVDAALGSLSVSPLELARAYQRLAGPDDLPGVSRRARDQVLAALASTPPGTAGTAVGRSGNIAWKTGTSSGRRDAWCVGVTAEHVVVVWFGRLDGRPAPELVGGRIAADLLVALVAAL